MNLISPRALVAALTLAASALLPVTASATPGTPTSAHPIDHLAGVSGVTAEKISYESTLMDGSPTTVTGVIYEPSAAWSGPGERPTIIFAPGTRGAATSALRPMPRSRWATSRWDRPIRSRSI